MSYKLVGKKILTRDNMNKFVIFYIDNCPFSYNALQYLDKKPHKAYKIRNKTKFFEDIGKLGLIPDSHRTFPVIFYNKQFIGGYSNLLLF